MDKSEIPGRVRVLLTPYMPMGMPVEKIVPEARLEQDLQIDSMDRLELVLKLEQEIDADITDHEADQLKTVGDIHALLEKALA